MAVTTYTSLSTADQLLKDVYLPRLREQFYSQTPAYNRLKKKTESHDFKGRQALIAAHYQWSESVGARDEGDTMPSPDYQKAQQMSLKCAYLYGVGQITGQAMAAADKEGPGAFANLLKLEMNTLKRSLLFDIARQTIDGDGTGRLATVTSGTTGTTVAVTSTKHLRVGMSIDIYQAGGTQEVSGIKISAVSPSALTITLASSQTFSTNSFVYRAGSRNKEMQGLRSIIDDGTNASTFQGTSRSTYPWLQSLVLTNPAGAGTLRSLTLRDLTSAVNAAEKFQNGGGGYPTAFYSKHVFAEQYADLLRADRRYGPEIGTLDGGFTGIQYTGPEGKINWYVDRMCADNAILMPQEDDLGYWELAELQWFDRDGAALRAATNNTDAYEFRLYTYCQMGSTRCNGHIKYADLSES